jgi:hypothetical protein
MCETCARLAQDISEREASLNLARSWSTRMTDEDRVEFAGALNLAEIDLGARECDLSEHMRSAHPNREVFAKNPTFSGVARRLGNGLTA